MRDVVSIPRVVLGLLVSSCCIAPIAAAEKPWPYNLPRDQKYYPEHEALVKRNLEIEKRLATQAPVGVRKMSNDPGEMFFLDYWQFEDDETSNQSEEQDTTPAIQARWPSPPLDTIDNTTLVADFLPPFLLHTDDRLPSTSRFLPRNPRAKSTKASLPAPAPATAAAASQTTPARASAALRPATQPPQPPAPS
ncbi:hypothetical protein FH972_025795 [Carpinus fangiana]|uniref:Uncharacterized protein n=1 Tax=Carpinus fangiana TaxID=176857 RepID=A0A5N6L319_9ROSI|nr:hypothetical protein FH972_025795 [Carpinus fangiana]